MRSVWNAEGAEERANDWDARVGVACPIIQQARGEGSWPIRGKGERPLPQTERKPPQRENDWQPDRNRAYRDMQGRETGKRSSQGRERKVDDYISLTLP